MSPSIVRGGLILNTLLFLLGGVLLCDGLSGGGSESAWEDFYRVSRVRRIVNGHLPEQKDSYGYVASIRNYDNGTLKHICGGSYIGNGWVLTAAHCFVSRDWRNFYVRLGIEDMTTATLDNSYKALEVRKNNFVPLFLTNDIALLRIDYNGPAQPIKYSRGGTDPTECHIGGYGSPAFNHPLSDKFKVANIKVVPRINCVMKLGFMVLPSLSKNILCVGGGDTDTCQGDSGSGLICNGVLYGITSYGRDCGIKGVPAIYTSVGQYSPWVSSIVNEEQQQ